MDHLDLTIAKENKKTESALLRNLRENVWQGVCINNFSLKKDCSTVSRQHQHLTQRRIKRIIQRKKLQKPALSSKYEQSTVRNTEGLLSSEGLNNVYDGVRNLQSKGRNLDSSCDEIKPKIGSVSRVVSNDKTDLDNPLLIGSKGSDGVVSNDKTDFDTRSSIMSDDEYVHHLRFRRKRKPNMAGV